MELMQRCLSLFGDGCQKCVLDHDLIQKSGNPVTQTRDYTRTYELKFHILGEYPRLFDTLETLVLSLGTDIRIEREKDSFYAHTGKIPMKRINPITLEHYINHAFVREDVMHEHRTTVGTISGNTRITFSEFLAGWD